jgi:hypothetical protein
MTPYNDWCVGGRYLRNGRYRPKADFGEKIAPAARFECATYALEGRELISCKCLLLAESGPSAPKRKPPTG